MATPRRIKPYLVVATDDARQLSGAAGHLAPGRANGRCSTASFEYACNCNLLSRRGTIMALRRWIGL